MSQSHESNFSSSDSNVSVLKILDKKFELISVLGKGGNGTVYKARHISLDNIVAIKLLNEIATDKEKAEARFLKEAQLLSELKHENIVQFQSFGKSDDGRLYMVLEYLPGKTLAEDIKESGALNESRALEIFIQIASGLDYAHAHGIIHRDLKPSNIMLLPDESEDGNFVRAKILDFGIFKAVESDEQNLTRTGILLGSINYMSPEQCKGQGLDRRSDIYSFACLAYETLSGTPPMQEQSEMLILSNHVNKVINEIPARYGISRELDSILVSCLSKDPDARIQSSAELLKNLESCRGKSQALKTNTKKRQIPAALQALIASAILSCAAIFIFVQWEHKNTEEIKSSIDKSFNPTSVYKGIAEGDLQTLNKALGWLTGKAASWKSAGKEARIAYVQNICQLCRVYTSCMFFIRKNKLNIQEAAGKEAILEALKLYTPRAPAPIDFEMIAHFYYWIDEDQKAIDFLRAQEKAGTKMGSINGTIISLCDYCLEFKQADREAIYVKELDRILPKLRLRDKISNRLKKAFLLSESGDAKNANKLLQELVIDMKIADSKDVGIYCLEGICRLLPEYGQEQTLLELCDLHYMPLQGHDIAETGNLPVDANDQSIRQEAAKAALVLGNYKLAEKIARSLNEQTLKFSPENAHAVTAEILLLESLNKQHVGKANLSKLAGLYIEQLPKFKVSTKLIDYHKKTLAKFLAAVGEKKDQAHLQELYQRAK